MKRKPGLFLILIILLLLVYCTSVYADSSGYLCNDDYGYVRWTIDDDGNLEVFGNTYMPSMYSEGTGPWWPNKQITSAWIHSGILDVSEFAFEKSSLKSITLPSTLTYIGPYAFSNSSLESMMFHSRFTTIGEYAFCFCEKLTSLEIRNGVTKIYDCAFKGCPSLQSIFVRHDNPCFCAVDNVLYSKDKTTLIKYPSGSSATSFTIPEGVKIISPCAFDYSNNLESVTIASTVETIASGAFAHCENLKTVIFLGNAPSTNYVLQSAIYSEKDGMFAGDNLIAYYPFNDNTWDSIINPANGDSGFGGNVIWDYVPCDHIPVVSPAVEPTCSHVGFTEGSYCSLCGTVFIAQEEIPKTAHTIVIDPAIEANCLYTGLTEGSHCSVCGEIIEAQETTEITDHTYIIDQAVDSTCIEEGKTMGIHCSVCGKVLVAQNLIPKKDHTPFDADVLAPTETDPGVISGTICSYCKKVLAGQEIPAICDMDVFRFPKSLKTIDPYAFSGASCQAVIIPDGCEAIGEYAFDGCSELIYVQIPSSVENYPENAFNDCVNLILVDWKTE